MKHKITIEVELDIDEEMLEEEWEGDDIVFESITDFLDRGIRSAPGLYSIYSAQIVKGLVDEDGVALN